MITPDDRLPIDDSYDDDAEDQQSQQDIHSNGLDEDFEPADDDPTDAELLKQAYKAAESSYTLDFDEDDDDLDEEND
jgi:uncharacterized protein YxjI